MSLSDKFEEWQVKNFPNACDIAKEELRKAWFAGWDAATSYWHSDEANKFGLTATQRRR